MKIAFFTENSHAGGLDTFLVTLINHWPHGEDDLVLLGNRGHPGLAGIGRRLKRPCRIVAHRIPLLWEWARRLDRTPLPGLVTRIVSALLRYPFFLFYLVAVKRLLAGEAPDRLMVVNGGYPAGDTCRAASIVWNGVPAVHNFHNFAIPPRWWDRWIENAIDARLCGASRALVTVSGACAASMDVRPSIAAEKVTHILNGVAEPGDGAMADPVETRRALDLPDDAPLCLMLGTYEARKGHEFLLRAFRRVLRAVPKARLVICGYGYDEDVQRVRGLVDSLGLGAAVRLEGFRDDASALIAAADVLLAPSQAFESFGLTLAEAMARKVPFVATRVGGFPEVAGLDEGGYCVATDDVEGFGERIIALLGDAALRRERGEKGYRRYRERFTAQAMAAAYADLINTSEH